MVVEQDANVLHHLNVVQETVAERYDQVTDLLWGAEDTENLWNEHIDKINTAAITNLEENGISKEQMFTKFDLFDI